MREKEGVGRAGGRGGREGTEEEEEEEDRRRGARERGGVREGLSLGKTQPVVPERILVLKLLGLSL